MEQPKQTESESGTASAPHVHSGTQPDHAHAASAARTGVAPDRLTALQQAYLLEQLATEGLESRSASDLNKKIAAAAKRELHLNATVANRVRHEMAEHNYLEMTKKGRQVFYGLTEAGRSYLDGLERPALSGRTRQPVPVDEAAISNEVREGQIAYLLLQLLNADGQPLPKGEANKIPGKLAKSLGLTSTVANYRRAKLAEQNYIRIVHAGKSEQYSLTRDGLNYLAAGARHLEYADFQLKGKTLNALVAAARASLFERGSAGPAVSERPAPGQAELAEAVLAAFQDLRRERHGRSGLVPIHEVRQRIADHFGTAAARHDVFDEVILTLWRQRRLGLEAISDLADATEQQLNDSVPGTNGILFYLEAPREPSVASESL